MRRWNDVGPTAAHINLEAVRSYDLRGVVGRQLGRGDARQLGLAYAAWVRARALRRIPCPDDRKPEVLRRVAERLAAAESGLQRLRTVVEAHLQACGQAWDHKAR